MLILYRISNRKIERKIIKQKAYLIQNCDIYKALLIARNEQKYIQYSEDRDCYYGMDL